jgi:hypothetical protein
MRVGQLALATATAPRRSPARRRPRSLRDRRRRVVQSSNRRIDPKTVRPILVDRRLLRKAPDLLLLH